MSAEDVAGDLFSEVVLEVPLRSEASQGLSSAVLCSIFLLRDGLPSEATKSSMTWTTIQHLYEGVKGGNVKI